MSMVMAETYDAPMMDSGDIDVSMYAGGTATADAWLSAEASMGDVAFSADAATSDYMQDGIEVEMLDDNDDGGITEYEMADDGEAYRGDELEDIEVLDVSRAPSLPPVEHADVAVDAPAEHSELMRIPSSDNGVSVASGANPPIEPVTDDPARFTETIPDTNYPDHPSETGVLAESSAPLEGDAHLTVSSAAQEISSAVEESGATADPAASSAYDHPEELAASASHGDAVEGHSLSEHHPQDSQVPEGSDLEYNPPVVQADSINSHLVESSAFEDAAAAGDPHEISDGVYIDPPPPVLLSLPPSAENAECCLFNRPQSSTPLSTSGGDQSGPADESPRLLLHDRPTLYYEPLSSVFDALRHEEFIGNLPGCAEAELILDAYELELAIAEDNVYAHEVTLHELDVIHGGSDLHGPLRLRLKFVAPRFVTRYHLLRDQIARLNLTAEDDDSHFRAAASDPVAETDGTASQAEQHEDHRQAEDETHHEDLDEHREEPAEGSDDGVHGDVGHGTVAAEAADAVANKNGLTENQEGSGDDEGALEQQGGDGGVSALEEASGDATTVCPEDREVADEEQEYAGEHEDGVEDGAEEGDEDGVDGEDNLDEYEVHEYADADEGGDYVEHDEFPDDEDEFGDDLPEELGGQTEDAAYVHTGAVEANPEDSTYVEEGSTVAQEDALATSQKGDVIDVAQGDRDLELRSTVLDTNEHTDTFAHLDSAHDDNDPHQEDDAGDQLQDNAHASDSVHLQNFEEDLANEESTTLSSDNEDGLADDWDDGEPAHEANQPDALSRKSSTTTLASKTSKRTYDEVELDDFDDDPSQLDVASSPDTKRPRVQ